MKFIPRLLIGVSVLIILAAVGLVIFLSTFEIERYRGTIIAAAERATGRQLSLNGPMDLRIGLSPALVVEDVALANAAWGTRDSMARINRLEVEVALLPLLSSTVEVRRLVLVRPDIYLETDGRGRGNWVLKEPAPAQAEDSAEGEGGFQVSLDSIEIENATLVYRDGASGAITTVTMEEINLEQDSDAEVSFSFGGTLNDSDVSATGRIGNLDLFAVRDEPSKVTLSLTVGDSDLDADLRLITRDRLTVTGALKASKLVMADFTGLGGKGAKTSDKTDAASQDPDASPWPAAPLDLSALKTVNADLDLEIEILDAMGITGNDIVAKLVLKNGTATLKPLSGKLADGDLSGSIRLAAGGPSVATDIELHDADLAGAIRALGGPDFKTGTGTLRADLSASGPSVAAMVGNLDGTFDFVINESPLGARYIRLLGGDLVDQILPWAESSTTVNCIVGRFKVEDGVANADALLLDTPDVALVGKGDISLPPMTIHMQITPKPKKKSLLSLAVPFNITGPLTSPRVRPDTMAVAQDVAIGVLGSAMMPLGALLPLVSAGNDVGSCAEILQSGAASGEAETGGKASPGGNSGGDTGDGLFDDLEGALGTILP